MTDYGLIDLHLAYSRYDNRDDLRNEADIEAVKSEAMRQRAYIEQLHSELAKAKAEITLLKHSKWNWELLMWKLIKNFREGKQSKEEFLADFDRVTQGMVRFV